MVEGKYVVMKVSKTREMEGSCMLPARQTESVTEVRRIVRS